MSGPQVEWDFHNCRYGGQRAGCLNVEYHKVLDWLLSEKQNAFFMCVAFRSAFSIAIHNCHQVLAILQSGYLHKQCDCCGYSLLHLAVKCGSTSFVRYYLQRNVDVNARNHHGDTALHMAVVLGDHMIVQHLLTHGADPNARDHIGNTPLEICMSKRSSELVVHLLIKWGARVNNLFFRVNKTGFSFAKMVMANLEMPIYETVYHDDAVNTRRLLEAGACPEHRFFNRTALHVASMRGSLNCVLVLLEAGADINRQDSEGRTALHYAVNGEQLEVVRHLLSHGCNYGIEDRYGNTALDIAILRNHVNITDILLQRGARYTLNIPFEAVEKGSMKALAMLVHRGYVNGNETIVGYGTLLDYARQFGRAEFVMQLTRNGRRG